MAPPQRQRRGLVGAVIGLVALAAVMAIEPPAAGAQATRSGDVAAATVELEHQQQVAPLLNRPGRFDPELRQRFVVEYRAAAAPSEQRAVLKRYLPTLGADGILDVLETNPFCHSEAHELGKEIFARLGAIGPAVQVCGRRCTTACFHGVMMEAFHAGHGPGAMTAHVTLEDVTPKVKALCGDRTVTDTHEAGNCAHGVGHALLNLAGYDVGVALKHCEAFESRPLAHYCATGVFMEHDEARRVGERASPSLHYPCDTYTKFPAACYRYRTLDILERYRGDTGRAAAECLGLDAPRRRGCFYGLGWAHVTLLLRQPGRVRAICRFGDAQDRVMCINGVIETLADHQTEAAQAACRTLEGEQATVCQVAIENKKYGLGKPFHLYYPD